MGTRIQSSDPDISSERELVWQTIIEVINNDLPDRQLRVLAAVHFENIPMAEVARLLETNVNNIYKILHDAMKPHLHWSSLKQKNFGLSHEHLA